MALHYWFMFPIFLAIPELEILFFHNKDMLEKLIQGSIARLSSSGCPRSSPSSLVSLII